ncbi:MAG TPA: sulfurtransferase [Gammaproteobacteria bacterium]|nr:sulfurtransferase [Gammaproteobacteria bacterium]
MISPLVSTEWLATRLDRPELRVLDCSVIMKIEPDGTYAFVGGADEWAAAHIPGSAYVDPRSELAAKNAPLANTAPPLPELAATFERYGIGDGTEVVLYDRGNHAWATRVFWLLRACGFDAAGVLDGGWQKWTAEGRPTSTTPPRHPRGRLTLRPRPEVFADKRVVQQALGEPTVTLLNALSPEEHRGTAPTKLPRAGRIPGSRNVYCQTLIDPVTKAYKPLPELRDLFSSAGALDGERTIVYCGGGIAATSDAFVLALLGRTDVAVYDGSLAEWTADPTLPMERG